MSILNYYYTLCKNVHERGVKQNSVVHMQSTVASWYVVVVIM